MKLLNVRNRSNEKTPGAVFLLIVSLLIGACGTIPGAGPYKSGVRNSAEISVKYETTETEENRELNYALLEVSKPLVAMVDQFSARPLDDEAWPKLEIPDEIMISVGDTLDITIYEAKSGGLFIPKEAGVRPGNFINLPSQTVDSTGTISVPYVGTLNVVGLTTPDIQEYIVNKLKDRAIDPQVIVTFGNRNGSEVSIIGEVNDPRRYSLNFNGETILDAIARAGGPKAPGYESFVTLQRAGSETTLLLDDIVQHPNYNIYLKPNDIVYVYRQPNTYSVFGAANRNGRHEFGRRKLYLSEAIGNAEGLNYSQADASEIFVFRKIDKDVLRNLILDEKSNQETLNKFDRNVEAIFHFNLRDPKGLFYTQSFSIKDNDIIFIPDADTVDLQKFISILGPASATAVNIKILK